MATLPGGKRKPKTAASRTGKKTPGASKSRSKSPIYRGPERRKPVLIVQHAPHEHPAALRRALESQGIVSKWIHPYHGEAFPEVSEISGMVSLGGPMGANDEADHPWIATEIRLLGECVGKNLPVVGICLGGQMLARALGGRVEKNPIAEVGWFPLEVTAEGLQDQIMGVAGTSPTVYHWHGDTFHLPPEALLLASSLACDRQAYRVGDKVYGFQFHPEADHQLVLEWLSIEGVEEDIHFYRDGCGGTGTVQDSKTQRNIALKGEKASLKITAALGTLFRKRQGVKRKVSELASLKNLLQDWATHRSTVLIEFEGSHRKTVHLRGKIETLLSLPVGEFVIVAEENTLLWPIRIDDIQKASQIKTLP